MRCALSFALNAGLAICLIAGAAPAPQPITQEPLRRAALNAIFPGMGSSARPPEPTANIAATETPLGPMRFPDAMAAEPVYLLDGLPLNAAERCAALDVADNRVARRRRLRLKLYALDGPNESSALAVLQYKFDGVSPAGSCWSIAKIVLLDRRGKTWTVTAEALLETSHHTSLNRIAWADLTGDGRPELIIESDAGGGGYRSVEMRIFDVARNRFDLLTATESWIEGVVDVGDEPTLLVRREVLDVDRTRATGGQRFCFQRTEQCETATPQLELVCYPRGEGDDGPLTPAERSQ